MVRWNAKRKKGREKRKIRRKKGRRERERKKKENGDARKGGKISKDCVFQLLEGRKEGSLKRRVRSQLARWEIKNCTPLRREAHFEIKIIKTHQVWSTFKNYDVEKMHVVVARSTFPSQSTKYSRFGPLWKLRCWKSARRCGANHISKSIFKIISGPEHFWKFRCRKSARRCGPKHISKFKYMKQTRSGRLLAVEMLKKCMLLWHEIYFHVKIYKKYQNRTSFGNCDIEKIHTIMIRIIFRNQNK